MKVKSIFLVLWMLLIAHSAMLYSGVGSVAMAAEVTAQLPVPKPLKPFNLGMPDGSVFNLDRLKGKWTFLFFGYTYCLDECPLAMKQLARVHELLLSSGFPMNEVQVLFISIDPRRDNKARLKEFASGYNPRFLAASGKKDQVDGLAAQVGANYKAASARGKGGYKISHSDSIFLVNPDAQLTSILAAPHQAVIIAQQLRAIHAGWGKSP